MTALRRHSLLLLVVAAVQVPTAFAFRAAILPGTNANTGMSISNARSAAPPRMSATPQEEQAVADFKMITEEEANLRKIGGVAIGAATGANFFFNGHDYAGLSTGAFAALSTYRTGSEYQWGCIAVGGWNVGRPFSFERVPAQFQGFVKEKQVQIANNIATSAVFGVAVANAASLLDGEASAQVLLETSKALLPVFGLVAVAVGATTFVVDKE